MASFFYTMPDSLSMAIAENRTNILRLDMRQSWLPSSVTSTAWRRFFRAESDDLGFPHQGIWDSLSCSLSRPGLSMVLW